MRFLIKGSEVVSEPFILESASTRSSNVGILTYKRELVAMIEKRKISVLYLEDDQDSIELVTFTLGLDQIKVTAVSKFDHALELAASGNFDLYLLDGLVDSGYTFEFCRELRRAEPNAPIVFYSALGFPQDIKEGVAAGADAYLVKPFVGDLAQTLRRVMNEKQVPAAQTFITLRPAFGSTAPAM